MCSPSYLILHHEYHQCIHWVFGFPITSGLIPSCHSTHCTNLTPSGSVAENVIIRLANDVANAKDNLLQVKTIQATYANKLRGHEIIYQPGDKVMLSTFHRCWDYKCKGDDRFAKFFPRWDGPYTIINAHPETSSYTLDNNNAYPYYTSKLRLYLANDPQLFPNRKLPKPGPVLTSYGMWEHKIEQILNEQPQGHRYWYLVWWVGYGPEDDKWLLGRMLKDCEGLNRWIESGGSGLASGQELSWGFQKFPSGFSAPSHAEIVDVVWFFFSPLLILKPPFISFKAGWV